MMKINGAIFDMDGTLVNSLMFWDKFWADFGEKYFKNKNYKPSDEVGTSVRTMIFTDALAYIADTTGVNTTVDELIEFGTAGVVDFYRNEVLPKEGAWELIDGLKARGIKVCIATATDMSYVRVALESCGLKERIDTVFSCADIGVGKDRPDIYLLARDALDLPIGEICVFEDSFLALETAKSAGFQTVGIYDQYSSEQERLKKASDIYLEKGKSLAHLLEFIQRG